MMRNRTAISAAVISAYILTIPAANWTLLHVGTAHPYGPRTVPVGFGYSAPSGVMWVGIALALRDAVQIAAGRRAVLASIACGALLTMALAAPSLALASAAAFAVSELADFAVYTPLARRRLQPAVLVSGAVGAVIDSLLFLFLAFGDIELWQGTVIGKLWMTLASVPLVMAVRHAVSSDPTH